jgi:hypothetical protein
MDPAQLQTLAEALSHHTVADEWPYWLALLAVGFVGLLGGSYLGSWGAKRGEIAAERAMRAQILEKLRETTQATEEVRSAVSLGEWSERERRALQRLKLEEMILLAFKTRDWLTDELHRLLYDEGSLETVSPQSTMRMLCVLYFPKLFEKVHAFDVACDAYHKAIRLTSDKIIDARMPHAGDPIERGIAANKVRVAETDNIVAHYDLVSKSLYALEQEAGKLMATIVTSPPKSP